METVTEELRASLQYETLKKEIESDEKKLKTKREQLRSYIKDVGVISESDLTPGPRLYEMTAIRFDKPIFLGNSTFTRRLEAGEQFKVHAKRIYGTADSSELYIDTEIGTLTIKK